MGTATEIVVRRPRVFPDGLHLYLGGDWPPGYGWAFGAGDTVRVGIGLLCANRHARRLDEALDAVVRQVRLGSPSEVLERHGGLIPLRPRPAVIDDLFVVGDAAGQALPGTAEGIRPALHFGTLLGAHLADVLEGRLDLGTAHRGYLRDVNVAAATYRVLALAQRVLTSLPRAAAVGLVSATAFTRLTNAWVARYAGAVTLPSTPAAPSQAPSHRAQATALDARDRRLETVRLAPDEPVQPDGAPHGRNVRP